MAWSGSYGSGRIAAICCCGVAMRVALGLLGMQQRLESTPELVVPSASWERANEGLFLASMGLSHYAGGVFTGSPLMLAAAALCAMLPTGLQTFGAAALFTAVDVASALLLRLICLRAVAVESCDWEVELEKWMDEDTRPPGSTSTPSLPCPATTAENATTTTTDNSCRKEEDNLNVRLSSLGSNKHTSTSPAGTPSTRVVDVTTGEECQNTSWQQQLPDAVVAVYLLNPILAAQCAALSGDVLGRVLPLAALAAAGRRQLGRSGTTPIVAAALAAATCLWRFHAAPLLLPMALMLRPARPSQKGSATVTSAPTTAAGGEGERAGDREKEQGQSQHLQDGKIDGKSGGIDGHGELESTQECTGDLDGSYVEEAYISREYVSSFDPLRVDLNTKAFVRLCIMFAAWCVVFLGACWLGTSPSWEFLRAAVRGQLLCEDLTPNAGLYWYFFAEVFPRFRGFFLVLFLSQPYVYVLPVVLRLGMFPEATATLLLAIFGFFHPYPTLADPVLAGCLFLCHPRTARRMRVVIPVCLAAAIPSLLLPTMRHLWLRAGTGNANFYYFQTVALNVLLSFFVLQFAAALVKRRKALRLAFEKRREAAVGSVVGCGSDGDGVKGG